MTITNAETLNKILAQYESSNCVTIEDFAKEQGYTVGYADWKLSEVRRALKKGTIKSSTPEIFEKLMRTSPREAKKLDKLNKVIQVTNTSSVDDENGAPEIAEEGDETLAVA